MCSTFGDFSLNDRLIGFSIVIAGKVCVLDKLMELHSLVRQNLLLVDLYYSYFLVDRVTQLF